MKNTDALLKRRSGLELMRICSMIMVLILHYNSNCGFLNGYGAGHIVPQLFESLCIIAVNCFVLLTGYFQYKSDFKVKKLLNLWLEVFFYSVLLFLFDFFVNGKGLETDRLLKTVFPVSTGRFWFISNYFVLLLLTPFINKLISVLTKKEHLKLILISAAVFSVVLCVFGNSVALKFERNYDFIWFIVLYLTGAYLNKYPPEIKKGKALAVYFGASLITFISKYAIGFLMRVKVFNVIFTLLSGGNVRMLETYSSFTSFAAAVSLFIFFSGLEIKSRGLRKAVNFTAALVLTCYLLPGEWTWNLVNPAGRYSAPVTVLYSAGVIAAIFIVCCLIELLRQLLFIPLNKVIRTGKLAARIEKGADGLLNKLISK